MRIPIFELADFRAIAAVFVALTIVSAGAAGYFATNPTKVVSTQVVTSTQTLSASGGNPPPPSVRLTYKAGVGFYLTNASGWTLYVYKPDNGTGASSCTGGCIKAWPAFYMSNLSLPAGFDENDFKLVSRADGVKQLAYYGWPLHYYTKDKAPGDTVGQGVGNVWFTCCNIPSTTTAAATGP